MLSESRLLRIGDWRVDPELDELSREGQTIRVEPRAMQLLLYLAAHPGQVIDVQQLLDAVWSNVVVTQGSVYQAVAELRRILGDDRAHPSYIENLPRRGYRLIAPVAPWSAGNGAASSASTLKDKKEEETLSMQVTVAAVGGAAITSASAAPPTPRTAASALGSRGWIGGGLIVLAVVAACWAIAHYRGVSKPAALTGPRVPPAIHSLVVLPLENLSGDKEQEYFADGMTDALTTDLAQIGSLRVISRTSAMHFKGSQETLPQIGQDLQVDAAVEGTVARGENRVRVTAQLVEASTDRHLWAKSYERDLKDVLALQDEIAQDITEQIRVKLTPKERSLLMQVHAVDPEAYDDSLKGWYWWNFTAEGASKALNYFQKAIAKDPSYALAYAGLADSFFLYGIGGDREAFSKAREAAVKALELDPSLAEAHTALANVKLYNDWDWSGAEAEYKQATALNPNSASAHLKYSSYLVAMRRLDEAMKEIERARDLDPFSPLTTWWLGQVLYHARRYDDALRQNQLGLEMHPDQPNFYVAMADVYEQKKMFAEAFAARQQMLSLVKDPNVTALGEAYKRSGYRGYLLKEAETLGADNPAYAAHVYARLNDEPRAMTALELCYNERLAGILFMRTSPELDSIRSSPRFRDLVRRIGFPPSPSDKN